jgi:hypothetical protein
MINLLGQQSSKSGGAENLAAYADHEVLTAERMKWWGVFLIREKRRLQGIADAVNANNKAETVEASMPPNGTISRESIEALLDRIDEEQGIHISESW